MRFVDPLGMVRLDLPAGWTEFPGSSGLFRLAFAPWTDDVWLTVEVYGHRPSMDPPGPGPAAPAWLRHVADAVEAPATAHIVEWPSAGGSGARAVFVHDNSPHRDALVVVGPRYDVVARCWVNSDTASEAAHTALRRLAGSVEVVRRVHGDVLEPEALGEQAQIAGHLLAEGDVTAAERAAQASLDAARDRFHAVASRDGSEAARGLCALVALEALSVLSQIRTDLWLAREGEILALRTANSLRDGGLPPQTVEQAQGWVSHFRRLQVLLMTGNPDAAPPQTSAAMAGVRQRWALARLSAGAVPTPGRVEVLDAALSDACLRVIDARLTGGSVEAAGLDALEPCLLMAVSYAVRLSMELTAVMDVEEARDVDDLAISLAESALAPPAVGEPERPPLVRQGLVQALLTAVGTLTEIGDTPALETAGERLSRAESELDLLGDEAALRAWACAIRASGLFDGRDPQRMRTAIDRGLAAAAADPVMSAPHLSLLLQAKAQLAVTESLEGDREVDLSQHLGDLEAALAGYADHPGVAQQRNLVLVGNSLVRQADLLRLAGRSGDALAVVVRGIDTLVRSAPFGTDAADAFRVAAAVLRDRPAAEGAVEPALQLTTIQSAMASMDVRQALFTSDEGRVAAVDADRARQISEEYVADALRLAPPLAFEIADGVRAKALARLVTTDDDRRRSVGAAASLDTLPPVPAPSGDDLGRLRAACDWMAKAASHVLAAAGVPRPLGLDAAVQLAKQTASLLVTLQPVEGQLVYLVVSPDGSPALRQAAATLDEIGQLADEVAARLRINVVGRGDPAAASDVRRAELSTRLERLSRMLVPPIEDLLVDGVPVILSPYRDLWPIPFGLLLRDDGRHLLDTHAVSLAPSLRTLRDLRARGPWQRSAPNKAFVVGDPLLSRAAKDNYLRQLPGAAQEALDVDARLRAFPGSAVTVVRGKDATEDAYVRHASGSDLVHLACHAMLEEPAMASCLFLAEGDNGDGTLTAREIPDVALDDALVVLSACQTAQGRPTADGLVGLARSYLVAGARAVVASNWQVADSATAALVGHLYDALLDREAPLDLARALQAATLATRVDLAAGRIVTAKGQVLDDRPAHWAPFVAIGECSSLRYG